MRSHEEELRGVLEVWRAGLTVRYRVLETRAPADGVLLGYLRADFGFADGTALPVSLGVLLTRTGEGWRIAHYQVSAS